MHQFKESMLQLIVQTSSNLPPDVRRAILAAMERETPGTQAMLALQMIAVNTDMACDGEAPICQDTGMPTFEIKTPVGVNQMVMKEEICEAIAEATKQGKLRPNSVDSLTGKNSGNNLGEGTEGFKFQIWLLVEEPRGFRCVYARTASQRCDQIRLETPRGVSDFLDILERRFSFNLVEDLNLSRFVSQFIQYQLEQT